MAQGMAFELQAHGRHDGANIIVTPVTVGEFNAGAVLGAAIVITAFRLGGEGPSIEDIVTLTLLSQQSMKFRNSDVEMHDIVKALETAVDDAVDDDLTPDCAKMLRDVVLRTHLN